jgi:alanine racemase
MSEPSVDSGVPEEQAGGILTIDLAVLARNWRALRDRAGNAECAAVVKADAYGIGIEAAVPALAGAGCRTFLVAHLTEGARARAVAPSATIYVLNGLLPRTAAAYAADDLRPVLGSQDEIAEWSAFCRSSGRRLAAAIHVDTGMNRLGLRIDEALTIAKEAVLADVDVALVMSHFVASEEPENPINGRQIEAFAAVRRAFAGVPASLSNSSGIFLPQNPHYDLVRPGYALYGGDPTPGGENPMRPVVRLDARIVQIRSVGARDTAGYNGQWSAPGPRRLATLSVGYADGYPRAASATDAKRNAGTLAGEAIVAGRRCAFAGRVSMDLMTVDISAVDDNEVARGDLVTLIGDGITIEEVGARSGTIGYEILTSLGRRFARRYIGASA